MRSVSKTLAFFFLACLLMPAPQPRAGNVLEFFFPDEKNLFTTVDDDILVGRVFWDDDFEPVNFVLHKPAGNIIPAPNPNGITDTQVFDAVSAALAEWNDSSLSSFDFDEALFFSNSAAVPNPKPTSARLDGHNFITFQSSLLDNVNDPVAITSLFFLEHAVSSAVIGAGLSAGEVENGVGASIDFNGDGIADITLPVRNYARGEIIEADIIFNRTKVFYAWPANQNSIPPQQLPQLPGSFDIQALVTHELGHAHGLAHTWLQDSTMFGFWLGAGADFPTNPYDVRSIALDDEIAGGILYPRSLGSRGVITGSVIDGQSVHYLDGPICASNAELLYIEQAPVYLGIPAPPGIHPDNVLSSSGVKRLIAQVMSGTNLRYPAGTGGVTTLEPATTTEPNIDFGDVGEDLNRNCVLDPGEDANFNMQLDHSSRSVNGTYQFRGIQARSDYVVYLNKNFKSLSPSVSAPYDYLGATEAYDTEFYGGIILPGLPDQHTHDDPLTATIIAVSAGQTVSGINIITNQEPFVSPTPTPSPTATPTYSPTPSPTASPTLSPSPTPTPPNFATLLQHNIPAQMTVGTWFGVDVTLTNTGLNPWTSAGGYALAVINNPCGLVSPPTNRIPLLPGETVLPGEAKTFLMQIFSPGSPQTCNLQFRMVQEFVEFFGEVVYADITVVNPPPNSAQWFGETVPNHLFPGEAIGASVTMKNTGTNAWPAFSAYSLAVLEDNCGLINPPLTRIGLTSTVTQGSTFGFNFNLALAAPAPMTVCTLQFRMVQEFVEFFGDTVTLHVNTVNAAQAWDHYE